MPKSIDSNEPQNEEEDAPFNPRLHAPSGKEVEGPDIDSDDFVAGRKADPNIFFNSNNQAQSQNNNVSNDDKNDKDDASLSSKV